MVSLYYFTFKEQRTLNGQRMRHFNQKPLWIIVYFVFITHQLYYLFS